MKNIELKLDAVIEGEDETSGGDSDSSDRKYVILKWSVKDVRATLRLFTGINTVTLGDLKLWSLLRMEQLLSCFLPTFHGQWSASYKRHSFICRRYHAFDS